MSSAPDALAAHAPLAPQRVLPWYHRIENSVVAAALAAMVILPIAEIVLRKLFNTGIPGVQSLTQHLVLAVGLLGPALAAREGRLLKISTLQNFLGENARNAAHLISNTIAAITTAFLCIASIQFVASERQSGAELIRGLPEWWVQCLLPIGFGLILLRVVWRSSDRWPARLVVAALVISAVLAFSYLPLPASKLLWPVLGIVILGTVLGGPVYALLGGAALTLFWSEGMPIASPALDHYRLVINPSLPAVPLFTLAGYLLAESKAPQRLIRVFRALFGRFSAGPALVTVAICTFFTAFTGASGVTILALGALLLPMLIGAHYRERNAIGLVTSAGSLGVLFPPSLPLILYAVIAKVPLDRMFLATALPGLLIAILLLIWGVRVRGKGAADSAKANGKEVRAALWEAKWELGTPLVALGALFGGIATPVEAAAVTALYAAGITAFRGDLNLFRDVPRVLAECALLVGGILLILGVALGLTNYLVDAQVPDQVTEWVKSSIESRWVFLLALNVCLLLVGCVMDVFSATVVMVPLIVPMAAAYEVDPVTLGVIFLANMELGFLTPLVGMNVIFAAYRFDKTMPEMMRAVIPTFLVLVAGVLFVTYLPALTHWLPNVVLGGP